MHNVVIRSIQQKEITILSDLLLEAIYQDENSTPLDRNILNDPHISIYIENFGTKKDDHCFVAERDGLIIGAIWARILHGKVKGYGNIDNQTPELSVSLFKEYRNRGIGTLMINKMIHQLFCSGYVQVSLSVSKANFAFKIYKRLGFNVVKENEEDYLMLLRLN